MIIGYYGNVRQGKTYGSVIELYQLYKLGYTIYSNTWLAFPFKKLTIEYLTDIVEKDLDIEDNCVFFIDEFPVWLDSRTSMSKRSRKITMFLAQSGKLGSSKDWGLIIIFTAQYPDMVDKRLRHFTDKAIESEKFEINGEKYFLQTVTIFRGKKSYSYKKILKGDNTLYSLYDTRKKIRYVNEVSKDELVVNIEDDE